MTKHYRIIFETYEPSSNEKEPISGIVLMSGVIEKPTNIFDFGFTHDKQVGLIQSAQNLLLEEQISLDESEVECCPHCPARHLVKYGKRRSNYHDVFTDHKLTIGRKRCPNCHYEPGSTIKNMLGGSMSADLIKLQSELGSDYTYRESEQLFSAFSRSKRSINNHDRIKGTVEQVGAAIRQLHQIESEVVGIEPASELIINVDGGHINTMEDGKRSFEAMTAVVYKPEALVSNNEGTRNILSHKHCAASALNDGQQSMTNNTIVAALKEGLCPHTKVTALCDGAENCWQIVETLKPLAASMTCILDWFHLSMKIQNISLPEQFKSRLIHIKWHLWRGKTDNALTRLTKLIKDCPEASRSRLEKLKTYITNNAAKIVDYRARQKQGLVFTSNLAESTVESLINQRCKGQQHMRWSREGLDPLLQLRAAISSNDWHTVWKTAVANVVIA
jgi:Uncharacterised protein family (UPF0236)